MDTKKCTTKHRTITEYHNWSTNQQRISINKTITLERTAVKATGGLNAFYWYQIFALYSAVVEAQKIVARTRILYYCNVSLWRNKLIKLTHYDEIEKMAQDSQIVRAKENLKLSHGGPSYSQTSGTKPQIKALCQSHH